MRVDLFARGRADVALLRPRVLLVDALLDLGQQPQQLAPALFLLALLRACPARAAGRAAAAAPARGGSAPAAAAAAPAAARSCAAPPRRVAELDGGRRRQRRGGAALLGLAAAGQVGLRDRLRLGRALVGARVDQDHLERRVLEHAVEALRVDEAHGQQRRRARRARRAAPSCSVVSLRSHAVVRRVRRRGAGAASAAASAVRRTSIASVQRQRRASASSSSRLVGGAPSALRPSSRRASSAGVHLERQQVDAGEAHAHARAARQALAAERAEHQRQRVGAHQAVLHHRGVELARRRCCCEPAQRPVALDRRAGSRCRRRRRHRSRDDREQRRVLRLERRGQRGGAAVARAGDDLPLVDQVDVAAQRRGRPGCTARRPCRRAAPAWCPCAPSCPAPGWPGCGRCPARRTRPASRPSGCWRGSSPRRRSGRAARRARACVICTGSSPCGSAPSAPLEAEVVVGPVEGLGLAAHQLAPRLQLRAPGGRRRPARRRSG